MFKVHKCGTEIPRDSSSLLHGTCTVTTCALRCVYFHCSASPLLRVTFLLYMEKGESSLWQPPIGLDYQPGPGVARSWPDIATLWFFVEHKQFHGTPTPDKAILWPCKIKTKTRVLCNHAWIQKQESCPNHKKWPNSPLCWPIMH